jgi:hypothetical protein
MKSSVVEERLDRLQDELRTLRSARHLQGARLRVFAGIAAIAAVGSVLLMSSSRVAVAQGQGMGGLLQRIEVLEQKVANLESAQASLESALAAEVAARQAADTALQEALNNEVAARAAADTTLQAGIDAEASARAARSNPPSKRRPTPAKRLTVRSRLLWPP